MSLGLKGLKNVMNYKCRSLSNHGTNKTVVCNVWLLRGRGEGGGVSMGRNCP